MQQPHRLYEQDRASIGRSPGIGWNLLSYINPDLHLVNRNYYHVNSMPYSYPHSSSSTYNSSASSLDIMKRIEEMTMSVAALQQKLDIIEKQKNPSSAAVVNTSTVDNDPLLSSTSGDHEASSMEVAEEEEEGESTHTDPRKRNADPKFEPTRYNDDSETEDDEEQQVLQHEVESDNNGSDDDDDDYAQGKSKKRKKENNKNNHRDKHNQELNVKNKKEMNKETNMTWSNELHRLFIASIFDIGLAQASPKNIIDMMLKNGSIEITPAHIKSHLQKYRNNSRQTRQEFLDQFQIAADLYNKKSKKYNWNQSQNPFLDNNFSLNEVSDDDDKSSIEEQSILKSNEMVIQSLSNTFISSAIASTYPNQTVLNALLSQKHLQQPKSISNHSSTDLQFPRPVVALSNNSTIRRATGNNILTTTQNLESNKKSKIAQDKSPSTASSLSSKSDSALSLNASPLLPYPIEHASMFSKNTNNKKKNRLR